MRSLESRKYRHLHIYPLLGLLFFVHIFVSSISVFSSSFVNESYPLFRLLDGYFMIQLIFSPVLFSSLVKKVVEIEEKDNMFLYQEILGIEPSALLLKKWSWLNLRLLLLQIMEWAVLIMMASRSSRFSPTDIMSLRILIEFAGQWLITAAFVALFLILETRSKSPYFTLFFSMAGTLTGIISMLTSSALTFMNPFAWIISLMNISYVQQSGKFESVLNPTPFVTPFIAIIGLVICLFIIKNHTLIRYDKTF